MTFEDALIFLRALLYPSLSYALVTMAWSGEKGRRSKHFVIHLSMAGIFLVLFGATLVKLANGSLGAQRDILNYLLTPVLLFGCCYAWYFMIKRVRFDEDADIDEKSTIRISRIGNH